MKLLRAEFKNFRLLRDLEIDFATASSRKLTVIRAANESGKTTLHHALQWALYGDEALPSENFRLCPIDWDRSQGPAPVSVTVDYELMKYRRSGKGAARPTLRRYRIERSTLAHVDSSTQRRPADVTLLEFTDKGVTPQPSPDSQIREDLPIDLREVFFTDGDRALSFIDADAATVTKRSRVQGAIQSLLGLGVIQDAIGHVTKTEASVNRRVRNESHDEALKKIAEELEVISEDLRKAEEQKHDADKQFAEFDRRHIATQKEIEAALEKGNREDLSRELRSIQNEVARLTAEQEEAAKDHSRLFRSRALAVELMAPVLSEAFVRLEELRDKGQIPNTTIPVLEDRLGQIECICGETLDPSDDEGERRREHIQALIERSRRADETAAVVTDLYYDAKPLAPAERSDEQRWPRVYGAIFDLREQLEERRDQAGRRQADLDHRLKTVPVTDVSKLRGVAREYKKQRDHHLARRSELSYRIDDLRRRKKTRLKEWDERSKRQQHAHRIRVEMQVVQDILQVLNGAYGYILNEELAKVSEQMNSIFLRMIGGDDEQRRLIQRAGITKTYDITVHGPENRPLNPDPDLNGASRRALTLAFILALAKVSEVSGPNVIDTPLGMTSGYVRRSILETAIQESTQLVLLLTHDEVAGCEPIIEGAAGKVVTLTNTAHYPGILVNDPGVEGRQVIRCSCSDLGECPTCRRYVSRPGNDARAKGAT